METHGMETNAMNEMNTEPSVSLPEAPTDSPSENMVRSMPADVKASFKQGLTGSAVWGVVLILLGVGAIAYPFVATVITETWVAAILAFAGGAKLVYTLQTREQEGFIWKLLLSALYIATAVFLFVYPLQGVLTLTLVLGSFLLTEGIFEIVLAFRLRPSSRNWGWVLANGITTLVLGGLIWFNFPLNAPWAIGTLMGISVLATGISRLMLSLAARAALGEVA
jgi:uncharacterized membrane protein HdeD (DUF308 family)